MSANTSSDLNNKMSTTAAKSSKKSVKSEVAAPVAAPAPVAAAAKEAKAPKAKAAKAEVAVPAPVTTPAVAAPVAAEAPAAAAEEDVAASLQKSIAELHEQLSGLKTAVSAAASLLKTVEKQAVRLGKKAERKRKRKADAADGAAPKSCYFTIPLKISDELCSFLGKPKSTEISRSAVTTAVMAYAHSHNLMDKQRIKTDATLRKLLTVTETDVVTILNLQKYLNRHYIKPTPAAN